MPKFGLKMNSQWSNVKLKGQMMIKFYDFVSTESWWKKESNETKIKWFRLKIYEKSLFQNQQKFAPNLAKMKNKLI